MTNIIKCSIIATIVSGAFAVAAVAQNTGTGTAATGGTGTGTTGTSATTGSGITGAGSQGNLEALFKRLDTNADGNISRDEFTRGGAAALSTYQGSGSGTSGSGATSTGGTGGRGTGSSSTGTGGTGTSGTGTSGSSR